MNFNLGVSQRIKLQFGPQWGILAQEHVDSLKTSQSIFKNGDLSLAASIMFRSLLSILVVGLNRGLQTLRY